MLIELRAAWRSLARRPGFSTGVVLTLALGLGATIALWSVVYGVVYRPLPFDEPEELMMITRSGDVSLLDVVDWRSAVPSVEKMALFMRSWAFDLTGDFEPEPLSGMVTEPEYFDLLNVPPLHGRALQAQDDVVGGSAVAVISEAFWRRRFASDPAVVGTTLTLSNVPTMVIGIMPQRADVFGDGVDLWAPVKVFLPWSVETRGSNNFDVIGRLAPGASLAAARTELRTVCERLEKAFPDTNTRKIVEPMPLDDFILGRVATTLELLLLAVLLVLLIACLNVGTLLLVRTLARAHELGVRSALGAGRLQLLRPHLAETAILFGLGGLLGIAVAFFGRNLILALAPEALPRAETLAFDSAALLFALGAILLSALIATLLPLRQSWASAPGRLLQAASKGSGGPRSGRVLALVVTAQIALATLLLVGAAWLILSLRQLAREDLGFVPEDVWTLQIVLPEVRYPDRAAQDRAFPGLVESLAALPEVKNAAYVASAPLEVRGGIGHQLIVEGRDDLGQRPAARSRPVHGDYFAALGLEMASGRALALADMQSTERVAVVNQTFARRFFPDQDPLGLRIAWRYGDQTPLFMTIVGVARDVKARSVAGGDEAAVYQPFLQRVPEWIRFGTLVVKTKGPAPTGFARSLREAIWRFDPDLPIANLATFEQRWRASLARHRFQALLLGAFAFSAMGLALQGLIALMAFRVEALRGELGLRAALGARGRDLALKVLVQALKPSLGGLALGLVASFLATPLIESLVFGIDLRNPVIPLAIAALLGLAVGLACWPQIRRSARIEPMAALRHD